MFLKSFLWLQQEWSQSTEADNIKENKVNALLTKHLPSTLYALIQEDNISLSFFNKLIEWKEFPSKDEFSQVLNMYQNFESIIKENLFYIVVSPGVKEKIRARLESENENISDENIKSIAFYLHKYYRWGMLTSNEMAEYEDFFPEFQEISEDVIDEVRMNQEVVDRVVSM